MSKSKRNTVDPNALIDRFGADTVRLFSLFAAPPEKSLEWCDAGVEGANRFLNRLWRQVMDHIEVIKAAPAEEPPYGRLEGAAKDLNRKTHATIRKVTEDIQRVQLNTGIAAVMELSNDIGRFEASTDDDRAVLRAALVAAVRLLSPYAPHICDEMAAHMGITHPLIAQPWPAFDEARLVTDDITLAVQVNGKVRSSLTVPKDLPEADILAMALADPKVLKWLDGKTPAFSKVVNRRIVTLVVK